MSANLRTQLEKLMIVAAEKTMDKRITLLKAFANDPKFFKAVRELAKNTINKNITLNKQQRAKLISHQKVIRSLVKKKTSIKQKRRLLIQKGTGFFLPLIVPLAVAIISKLVENSSNAAREEDDAGSIPKRSRP